MYKKKGIKMYVIAAIAAFICVGFIGCIDSEKNFQKEPEKAVKPEDFGFSTEKNVEINLNYETKLPGYQVEFEMYTTLPLTLDDHKSYVKDPTLTPFLYGRTNENGKISFKGKLPATVNEIYVYSTGIGVPVLMKASVSAEGAVSDFKATEVKKANATRGIIGPGPSGTISWKTYDVTLNKPTLTAVKREITQEIQSLIDKSFPENQNYDVVTTYNVRSIRLQEDARVKIYSVENGKSSDRTNALAYFTYTKDDEVVKPADVNSNLNLVFPELTKTFPAKGEGFKLLNGDSETFKAGSNLGFALFPDITPGNIKTKDTQVLYSCYNKGSWNTYSFLDINRAAVPHMALSLLKEENGHAIIAITFEDQPWSTQNSSNKGNFRDDIFILEIDPASSLPPDLPKPPTEEPAYEYARSSSGILCFEDSWPTNGDYDINDITVSYTDTTFYSKSDNPVKLASKYTFLNNGATFRNGFGYQLMGIKESDINFDKSKITSSRPNNGHAFDRTPNDVSVILFENGKNVAEKTTFNVSIIFNQTAILSRGQNPFIIVRDGKYVTNSGEILTKDRTEVHLATPKGASVFSRYLPTSKANNSYWGKEDDRSIPASKIYYVRESNYPFALNINWDSSANGDPANFIIPKEGETIDKTYPEFIQWVISGGKENADWYLHPNK